MIDVNIKTSPWADSKILIGRQAENNAIKVVFDLSFLIQNFGEGTAVLVHQRTKDNAPYIVTTQQDGSTLSWNVSQIDTAYVGVGQAELRWTVGDTLAKTIIYKTWTVKSITADEVMPDEYQSWYDVMIEYIDQLKVDSDARLVEAVEDARQSATSAAESATQAAAQTAEAVTAWLNAHPEATTTVQDSSLTYKKLVPGTLGFVTPEMFGAVGDGTTDDTLAMKMAFMHNNVLLNGTYKVTGNIPCISDQHISGAGTIVFDFVGNGNYTQYRAIEAYERNNVVIDGIKIQSSHCGIYIIGCENISIANSIIDTEKFGITVTDSSNKESKNIFINNISIRNDASNSSSDGIHVNGGSVNLFINNIYGTSGDDFIALNAIEGNRHYIKDVVVENVHYDDIDANYCGLRIYGDEACTISASFKNCVFKAANGLRLINTVGTYSQLESPLNVDCYFENCVIGGKNNAVVLGNASGDMVFDNCTFICSTTVPPIRYFNSKNELLVCFRRCVFETESLYCMQDNPFGQIGENVSSYINASFDDCNFDKYIIQSYGSDAKTLTFKNCVFSNKLTLQSTPEYSIKMTGCINTSVLIDLPGFHGYIYIRDHKTNGLLFSGLNPNGNLVLDCKDIDFENVSGTFINFSAANGTFTLINLEGSYNLPVSATQRKGAVSKRFNSNGFDGIYIYNGTAWKKINYA